jgi:PPK2 family polyphosphate:nucleotide phosphotransferase
MPQTHRLEPGEEIRLADLTTDGRIFESDRDSAEAEFMALRDELAELQRRWYADGRRSFLVVLQAMDAGGKDSTIRKVFRGVNPQGVRVNSFKKPTHLEMSHDYLWRVHKAIPPKGMIGIFNRSHYEDVLVVRVDELAPEDIWNARYEQINQFEKLLTDTGTTIVKIFLHISKAEQAERFQSRLDVPDKHWKFSPDDLRKRAQWDDYMAAYEDLLNRCTTEWAPWYVIPADRKWYRNLAIARILMHTLRELNPEYPPPIVELDSYVIK